MVIFNFKTLVSLLFVSQVALFYGLDLVNLNRVKWILTDRKQPKSIENIKKIGLKLNEYEQIIASEIIWPGNPN